MIIGITGGVGAGKSEVLRFLREEYDALVLEMDAIGREVMEPDGICFERICSLFGPDAVMEDGRLDRAYIADIVFHNPHKLDELNQIVHPAVREYCGKKILEAEKNDVPYIVMESAILLDAGYDAVCDEIWYIYAKEEVRAERLRAARGYSGERIRAVMKTQKSDGFFREHADFIVDNSGTIEEMKQQIRERLEK